ncbi:hypothetical protein NQ314_003339 [Rhamnusium bicolor]|uniref:Uncharacterized protein n=1 Tax=Rhamnusium bicolor TaxID=1586634 RepID=A0AAV8ZMF7_9CUCU|nr:hypothetical protein NQ314_003339 [Rhamnusium bicolor]
MNPQVDKKINDRQKFNPEKKQGITQARESTVTTKSEEGQRRLPARNAEGKPLRFACKNYGHVSKYCKTKQPEVAKETLTTSSSDIEKTEDDNLKYFKEARIGGKSIQSYVDQGSKCVLLRKSDADDLG